MASTYEPVIGIEIHAELRTRSKIFCGCEVVDSITADPNRTICPVCTGQPGALPVVNRKAVELAVQVGLALHCKIHSESIFARKNYFYPDLPKGYQISQYDQPLATNGWIRIDTPAGPKVIRIRRAHLEEDTGKLSHAGNESLIDYNRSGIPLLEIVSEPDLNSADEVRDYAIKIRSILRYLGANSGDMEKGVIRFEANVSVRDAGSDRLNTRTEIKNLNSFQALRQAVEYEIKRQTGIYDLGDTVVQETLGFNESTGKTYSQRGKESAHDYRYFPEPDLPPLRLDDAWIDALRSDLAELPDSKIERFLAMGLTAYDANVIVEDPLVANYFDDAAREGLRCGVDAKSISNWLTTELFSRLNESGKDILQSGVKPGDLVDLVRLVLEGRINNSTGKRILGDMLSTGRSAQELIAEQGLGQVNDMVRIAAAIEKVVRENPEQLAKFLGGKESVKKWFFGQVMRAMDGTANPSLVETALDAKLNDQNKAG